MGELHLEVIVDRMLREFKVDANVGRPQVAYRETVRQRSEDRGPFRAPDRRPRPVRPRVIDLEPAPGEGFDFVNKIKGGRSRRSSSPPSSRASTRRSSGRQAGYPMVDVKVTLSTASHDVDSSEMAFRVAGSRRCARPRGGRSRCCSSRSWPRGRDPRGVHGRRHRRPQPAPRTDRRHRAARERAGDRATCRWPRCSATRPTCARDPGPSEVHDAVRGATREIPSALAEEISEHRSGALVAAA